MKDKDLYDQGLIFANANNPLGSISYFEKAIEINPLNAFYYEALGNAKTYLTNHIEKTVAIYHWEDALLLDPGRLYLVANIKNFKEGCIGPYHKSILYKHLYDRGGRNPATASYCDELHIRGDILRHNIWGLAAVKGEDYEAAHRNFEMSDSFGVPNYNERLTDIGYTLIYTELGENKLKEGRNNYNKGVAFSKGHDWGESWQGVRRYESGAKLLNMAKNQNVNQQYNSSAFAQYDGDRQALEAFNTIKKDEELYRTDILLARGICYSKLKDYKKARFYLDILLKDYIAVDSISIKKLNNVSAYQGFYERGLVHQMIEDSESAIDDFQIAIEIAKTLDWKNCLVTRAGPFLALQQEKPKVIQKIEKAKNIVMQAKKAFIEEKYQYSLELSEKAIKAYKASEKSYLYAAFSHFKLKNYDEIKIYLNNFYIIFTKNNKGSKIPSEVKKFEQDLDLRSIALNKYNGWLKMLPELMPNEIIVDTIKSVFSGGWIKKEKEEKLKELIEECLKSAKFPIGFSSEDRKVLSEGISKGIKSFFIHKPSGKSGKSASHVRFNIKTKSISKDAGLARSIDQAITDSMEAISQRIQQKQIQFPEESLVESIVECDKVLNKGFENIEKNILEINRIINNTSGSAIMKKSPKKNLPLIQSEKLVSTSLPILKSNPFSSLKNQQPRIEVIALYDFTSENERELSFQRGDKMHVTDQSNGEWWHAEFKGRAGYIPSNFIQIQDKKDLPEIQNRNNDIISDSNVSKKSKINIQRESKNSNQSHIDESKNQTKDTPKTPNLKKENPVSSKTRNSVVIKSQNERIKDLNEALKILTESTQKKILSLSEVNKEYQEFEKEALQLKSTNFYISRGQFYFESAENEMSSTRKEILYQNALQDYKKALNYDPFLEGIPDEIDKIQALLKGNSSQGGNHGFFATVATNVALNQKPKEQSMPTRDNLTAEQLQELEKIKTQLRQQGPGRF